MNLPKRKPARLKDYDYSTIGAYFVTICTKDKEKILSKIIVGNVHECSAYELTAYGKIVDDIIKTIPERFNISVDKYVIMPNHIHLLLSITNNRDVRERPLQEIQHSIISNVVGYLKMNSSKKIHHLNKGEPIWQRSYHDHIIRGEQDYKKIWEYIDTNVAKWELDCFYNATE